MYSREVHPIFYVANLVSYWYFLLDVLDDEASSVKMDPHGGKPLTEYLLLRSHDIPII